MNIEGKHIKENEGGYGLKCGALRLKTSTENHQNTARICGDRVIAMRK